MPRGIPDASNLLWVEGQAISLDFNKTSPTTGTLTWNIPTNAKVYNGILITASIKEINPSNYPTDGVLYDSSTDLSTPADLIGSAQVVVALYDDSTTTSMSVTGLLPDTPYHFSAHVVSNVYTYFTIGVRSYPASLSSKAYAGDMPKSYGPPANPTPGSVYYDVDQSLIFVWDGSSWLPTSAHTTLTGPTDPVAPFNGYPAGYPSVGDFFYNSTAQMLRVWSGTNWRDSESEAGDPMYAKQGVGTDMSYSARANIIDILKKQLGYPVVCVELTEDHFNIALDNALQELRRRADSAYTKQYFFMTIVPNQDIYYLNDGTAGTDRIVDVLKIHRVSGMGLINFGPDNIYAQQFLQQFYGSSNGGADLVSIHLMHSMAELYSQLFAGEIAFNWREASRELRLYRRFGHQEKVLLETSCEKLEQELLTDRWAQQWIQQWAEAECMLILAHIRGKFATLPGPGGSLSLNADTLLGEGQRLQEDCLRQMKDYEVGQNGPDGFYMPFTFG